MPLNAAQRAALLRHPAGWIASGFGSGLSPLIPGTAGSLASLLPWIFLRDLPLLAYLAVIVGAFAVGVWACAWLVDTLRVEDPGAAVWDEFVGQWITLLPLVVIPRDWIWVAVGFILFRIMDILKPWPASWADRQIGGGLGVMLDDAIAGVYAALTLYLAMRLF